MDGRTDRQTDGRTDRGKTVYPTPVERRGYNYMQYSLMGKNETAL